MPPVSFKPSGFFYRQALRETDHPERLRALGEHAVTELEQLRSWCYAMGMRPPIFNVLHEEFAAKPEEFTPPGRPAHERAD